MTSQTSPYLAPGFYDREIAKGRHRDIVGGRWEETGEAQMAVLQEAGLEPHHKLLDIGAGSLRLGCRAVPYLAPGNYWATDQSRALMLRGHEVELSDPARLNPDHLIEDASFALPGIPDDIDFALCFAVFTHLPFHYLQEALPSFRARLPKVKKLIFTVFLAPEGIESLRQRDGVVTHASRTPWHFTQQAVADACTAAGFTVSATDHYRLPRGQVLFTCTPPQMP